MRLPRCYDSRYAVIVQGMDQPKIDVPKVGRSSRGSLIFSVHELARRYELIGTEQHHIVNDW